MKKGGKGTCVGEDGKGGEGGGGVVGAPRQSIELAIAGALAIDDVVVVGSEGGGPSGMSSGCCSSLCKESSLVKGRMGKVINKGSKNYMS